MKRGSHVVWVALVLALALAHTHAKTIWHTPNKGCPVLPSFHPCPALCAPLDAVHRCPPPQRSPNGTTVDHTHHPHHHEGPHCPPATLYCPPPRPDRTGRCQPNPLLRPYRDVCGPNAPPNPCGPARVPCPPRYLALAVPHGEGRAAFHARRDAACRAAFSPYAPGVRRLDALQAARDAGGDVAFRWGHPVLLLYLAFLLASLAVPLLWCLYTRLGEVKDGIKGEVKGEVKGGDSPLLGYATHPLGTAVRRFVVAATLGYLAWLLLWLLDTHGLLHPATAQPHPWFPTPTARTAVFIATWHAAALWLFVWVRMVRGARWATFFRVRVARRDATHVFFPVEAGEGEGSLEPVQRAPDGTRFVVHRCARHVWDPVRDTYTIPPQCPDPYAYLPSADDVPCLTHAAARHAYDVRHGPNAIPLTLPSFPAALVAELTATGFYAYQLMTLLAWVGFAYHRMALVVGGVVAVSAVVKVRVQLQARRRVASMTALRDRVTVLRRDVGSAAADAAAASPTRAGTLTRTLVSSEALVPGDVLVLAKDATVPADCVLIRHGAVMDEAMLTGEAMPVQKHPLAPPPPDLPADTPPKASCVYAGTRVLQTAADPAHETLAVVRRTGVHTDKGAMLRAMLYPRPLAFVFDTDLRRVLLLLLLWALAASALIVYVTEAASLNIWFYVIIALSQVLSPLLPAVLVVGQSVAARRLARQGVLCTDHRRIPLAGKTRVFCFDKTGTLTQDGLAFVGALPVRLPRACRVKAAVPNVVSLNKQLWHVTDPADPAAAATPPLLPEAEAAVEGATDAAVFLAEEGDVRCLPTLLQKGMASAHTVAHVDGAPVGPPVDVALWRACGWAMDVGPAGETRLTSPQGKRQLRVLRTFPFAHALMRMTVVVVDRHGDVHVYTKGSFEAVRALCQPDTLPAAYDATCAAQAARGCYVLGLAHKRLGALADLPVDELHRLTRGVLEADLHLLGLLLFRNPLKPDTPQAIAALKRGHVRPVMITGDTALTGVFVARACRMLHRATRHVYLGDVAADGALVWTDVDTQARVDVDAYFDRGHAGEDLSSSSEAEDAAETLTSSVTAAALPQRIPLSRHHLHLHHGRTASGEAVLTTTEDESELDEVTTLGGSLPDVLSPIMPGTSPMRPSPLFAGGGEEVPRATLLSRSTSGADESLKLAAAAAAHGSTPATTRRPSSVRSLRHGKRRRRRTNSTSRLSPAGMTSVGMPDADDDDAFELAITGAAFRYLCDRGRMADYLLSTRVFARMTPEDKVACVQLHMQRAVTAMAGDGGNDCGALRASHVGIALSDADASVVSPFSGTTKSVHACVELLRQGRCALATSFASYKFVIMYGLIVIFTKLAGMYFSTLPGEAVFIVYDALIMLTMSWALTQAPPKGTLSQRRPTARLFGVETLASILGMLLVNIAFLAGALGWYLTSAPCDQFDGNRIDLAQWWAMTDSIEAAIKSFMSLSQMVTAAACFNLGGEFRRAWWRNGALVGVYTTLMGALVALLMAPPNPVSCLFRLQCGNDHALAALGYTPQHLAVPYDTPQQHNVLDATQRWTLAAFMVANAVVNWAFQYFVILGPFRRLMRTKRPLKRLALKH